MRRLAGRFDRAMVEPRWAYATILLLQLKVLWGVWWRRDLSSGDTSSYFVSAWEWYRGMRNAVSWSPLYTAFYGSLLHLHEDAYFATIAHRLVTVFALAVMILALMRRLLPPRLAWIAAAWWTLLPVYFDAFNEVHLFALLLPVGACLVISTGPGPAARGGALAILAAAVVLTRNEMLFAATPFAVACGVYEIRARTPARDIMTGYGGPLLAAAALVGFFYTRSTVRFPGLFSALRDKHTMNVCQVFAYGYAERHPEWSHSPWNDCEHLMQQLTGVRRPTLIEATRRAPGALIEHFLWNLRLLPASAELLLFGATSTHWNPDYVPVERESRPALILTALLALLCAAGLWHLVRDPAPAGGRRWVWILLSCLAFQALSAGILARPRPSFVFTLGPALIAFAGLCVHVLTSGRPVFQRLQPAFPGLVVALLVAVPPHFSPESGGRRYLLKDYRRLSLHGGRLARPDTVLAAPRYAGELCNYLVADAGRTCTGIYLDALLHDLHSTSLPEALARRDVTLLYVDEPTLRNGRMRESLASLEGSGWHVVGLEDVPDDRWMLLARDR